MKIKLNTRVKSRLKKAGILVLAVLVLSIAQIWIWKFVHMTANGLHDNRSQLRQVNDVTEKVRIVEIHDRDSQKLLDQLVTVVPRGDNILRVLERLEGVAGQLGLVLTVEDIDEQTDRDVLAGIGGGEGLSEDVIEGVDEKTGGKQFKPIVITVSSAGDAATLLDYVEAIEHVQELTSIESIVLLPNKSSGTALGEGIFKLTVKVVFYVQE